MLQLWEQYRSVVEFSLANALFALATWIAMWAGIFSMAAAAFGAAGAFGAAAVADRQDVPFVVLLAVGVAVGTLLAGVLSLLLLDLESHWLAMATIALVLISRVAVLNAGSVTGGSVGKSVPSQLTVAWLVGVLAVAAYVVARLRRTSFGIAAHAVREDPAVAAALGVDVRRVRRTAFTMSGAVGGAGGVVLSHLLQYIGPDTFYLTLAFTMVAAVVLGGAYHWAGPLLGAAVFVGLPEALRPYMGDYNEILTGVFLLVVMLFLPRGLVAPGRNLRLPGRTAASPRRPAEVGA